MLCRKQFQRNIKSTTQNHMWLFLCGWTYWHWTLKKLSVGYIWKTVDTFHCRQSGYLSSWVLGPYPQCEAEIYWGKASGRLSCQRQSVASSGWERLLCGAFIRNLTLKVFQIYQSLLSTHHACSIWGTAESSGPFCGSYLCPILSDIACLCASLIFVLMLVSKPYIPWFFILMGISALKENCTLKHNLCRHFTVWWSFFVFF